MDNTQLKRQAEQATGTHIKVTNCKCEGTWECFADAYPADAETVTYGRRVIYKSKPVASASAFGHTSRANSTTAALIALSIRLDVQLTEAAYEMNANRDAADFDARTKF